MFQGKKPFSEPELIAVKDFILSSKADVCLDVHCCMGTVLPVSYYHGETEELKETHLRMAKSIAGAMGLVYKFREREKEFSDTNSGIAVDWIFGEAKVRERERERECIVVNVVVALD